MLTSVSACYVEVCVIFTYDYILLAVFVKRTEVGHDSQT